MTTATHIDALTTVYGKLWADSIVRTLRAAGFIIVRKGAIGQAQREAVAAYREDLARPEIGENA